MKRGEKIKQKRLALGLSQRQLAKRTGVSDAFICQIEKDDRGMSIDILIKLNNILKIPYEELLEIDIYEKNKPNQKLIEKVAERNTEEYFYRFGDDKKEARIVFRDEVFKEAVFAFKGTYTRDQWKILAEIEKEITRIEETKMSIEGE